MPPGDLKAEIDCALNPCRVGMESLRWEASNYRLALA